MSGYVHYRGKITEIKSRGSKTLEEVCEEIVDNKGYEVPYYYESNLQYLTEELREYEIIFDRLFHIDCEDVMWEESLHAKKINNENYEFDVKFHNAGMPIREAIEKAIKELDNE